MRLLDLPELLHVIYSVAVLPLADNARSRALMYEFFNRHFNLGFSFSELQECLFTPLAREEATVWAGNFVDARPDVSDDAEVAILRALDRNCSTAVANACTAEGVRSGRMREVIGGWLRVAVGLQGGVLTEHLEKLRSPMIQAIAKAAAAVDLTASASLPIYVNEPNRPDKSSKPRGSAKIKLHLPTAGVQLVAIVLCDGSLCQQKELVGAIMAEGEKASVGVACIVVSLLGGQA